MADVWLACRTDGAFERQVALKIPRLHNRPVEMTARFALECNILAALECPGIARLYDAGVDASGVPYIAMEYVQGEPLVAWCDARGLDEAARIRVVPAGAGCGGYAHERQVIHRDLKPSNILVTGQGEVRLLDFGTARLLQPKTDGASLTRAYGLALTPEYASPELLRGEPIDARSDIYSLGVVLHELLTGARPAQPTRPATGDTQTLAWRVARRRDDGAAAGPVATVIRTRRVSPLRCGRSPTGERMSRQCGGCDGWPLRRGCMARSPRRRRSCLPSPSLETSAVDRRVASIAVLPFADLSEAQDRPISPTASRRRSSRSSTRIRTCA